MIEDIAERLGTGALWGLGIGLAIRVITGGERRKEQQQEAGGDGMIRPVAKTAMKGAIIASERIRGVFSEARESVEDIYAEARAETHAAPTNGSAPRAATPRKTRPRARKSTAKRATSRTIPVEA